MSVTLQQVILLKAADLLEDPSRWSFAADARDKRGRIVNWDSKRAVSFCVMGTLSRISAEHGTTFASVRAYLTQKEGWRSLMNLNDGEGRAAVIRYLRRRAKA
jgi:hypothetical protein